MIVLDTYGKYAPISDTSKPDMCLSDVVCRMQTIKLVSFVRKGMTLMNTDRYLALYILYVRFVFF